MNALLHNDFPGKIYPVNPGREQIQGLKCHPSVDAIGEAVDLVILSVPADDVPDQLRMGRDCGVGGFIVFASGFSETGPEGIAKQAEISQIVQDAGIPMIGPNCLGIMNGNHSMLASSTVVMGGRHLPGGNYAFATQSGALGTYWLDMTMKAGLGVSAWISTGNEADVDLAACLDYLAEDDETEVIGLHIEGIRDGAAFRAAARKAFERRKPVLVLKSGSSRQGATAAAPHTGALAGEDEAYDAIFRQYNICRSDTAASMAQRMLVIARTKPIEECERPIDGLSLFYTRMDPDYVRTRKIPKLGRNAVESCQIFIDGLKVPEEDRIGEEGKGFYYLLDGLNPERILVVAEAVGLGRVSLSRATEYAKERVVFDRPIGKNQGIQHPLAKCWMELEAANLMMLKAATLYDAGESCGAEANSAKYLGAEAGYRACECAVMTHGGYGYAKEFDVERYLREVMIPRLAPVSRELVMCYIAERVLGLPKSY